MRKYIRFILFIFVFQLFIIASNDACAKKHVQKRVNIRDFIYTYTYTNKNTDIWINEINIMPGKHPTKIKIPSQIKGKKVVKLGQRDDLASDEWFLDFYKDVFAVEYCDEDGSAQPKYLYDKVNKIKKIVLPKTLEKITPNAFYFLKDGKEINIPEKIKSLTAFRRIHWKKVSISKNNPKYKMENKLVYSKDGQTVYGCLLDVKKARIKQGAKRMCKICFWKSAIEKLYIPRSIIDIGTRSFYEKKKLDIKIEKGNRVYKYKKGFIIRKRDGKLVVGTVKNGELNIPEGVKSIGENSDMSYIGGNVKKIVFPKSIKYLYSASWFSGLEYSVMVSVIEFKSKRLPKIKDNDPTLEIFMDAQKVIVPKGCKNIYKKELKEETYLKNIVEAK